MVFLENKHHKSWGIINIGEMRNKILVQLSNLRPALPYL